MDVARGSTMPLPRTARRGTRLALPARGQPRRAIFGVRPSRDPLQAHVPCACARSRRRAGGIYRAYNPGTGARRARGTERRERTRRRDDREGATRREVYTCSGIESVTVYVVFFLHAVQRCFEPRLSGVRAGAVTSRATRPASCYPMRDRGRRAGKARAHTYTLRPPSWTPQAAVDSQKARAYSLT